MTTSVTTMEIPAAGKVSVRLAVAGPLTRIVALAATPSHERTPGWPRD